MVQSDEIDELSLHQFENKPLQNFIKDLSEFESVMKAMQSDGTACSDVRAIFDEIIDSIWTFIEDYHQVLIFSTQSIWFCYCKDPKSKRYNSVKGRKGEHSMSIGILISRKSLRGGRSIVCGSCAETTTHWIWDNLANYVDCRFIIPTSNICERLFPKIGSLSNNSRSRLNSAIFESQIFL